MDLDKIAEQLGGGTKAKGAKEEPKAFTYGALTPQVVTDAKKGLRKTGVALPGLLGSQSDSPLRRPGHQWATSGAAGSRPSDLDMSIEDIPLP
mmetsp:Transcript_2660/g.4276  ORF Transcript_2660/g.4276 Transcript_2660/m.4276 type:complete len:93 (+) Transcript_2660:1742-2020(+)